MHVNRIEFWTMAIAIAVSACQKNSTDEFTDQNPELIYEQDLVYQGAFRVPTLEGEQTYSWGGFAPAYNPANNSLFLVAHDHHQLVGEISIPVLRISKNMAELNVAQSLQNPVDITEGRMTEIGPGIPPWDAKIGGLLVLDNKLIGTVYAYYEGATDAKASHFTTGTQLSQTGDFRGFYTVGTLNPGFVAGYMSSIPKEYQGLFGGTMLTGQAGIPRVQRTSFGPGAFAVNASSLVGTAARIEANALVYYPEEHPSLGTWENSKPSPIFNMTTTIDGIVFPHGSKTVLFFGTTGIGAPRYGQGTDNPALDGTKIPGWDEKYVYDPALYDTKGPHTDPYRYYVWAYNADELAEVASGKKKPWEIHPYSHWTLSLPPYKDEKTDNCWIGGATYNPKSGIIYLSQRNADGARPIIHAFKVNM